MTKIKILLSILPILGASVVFIIFNFLIKSTIIISIIFSILTFFILNLINKLVKKAEKLEPQSSVDRIINESKSKLHKIKKYSYKVRDSEVSKNICKLYDLASELLDKYKEDPLTVNNLPTYYIDSIDNILKKYLELSNIETKSLEIENVLKDVEKMIATIINKLENEIQESIDENVIDLEAEIKVLDRTIKKELAR